MGVNAEVLPRYRSRPTVFLDTAVLIYAIGGEHPLLRAVGTGDVDAMTSALAVQELRYQRARRLGDLTPEQTAAAAQG